MATEISSAWDGLERIEALAIIAAVEANKAINAESLMIGVDSAVGGFVEHKPPVGHVDRIEDADALAAACREVLVCLGIAPRGNSRDMAARKSIQWRSLRPTLGPGALYTASGALDAVQSVQCLEGWATNIRRHYQQKLQAVAKDARGTGRKRGRRKREPLARFFEDLENLYFDLWDDVPAIRRSRTKGDWREAEATMDNGGVVARIYETGERLPVGFLRFLSELFPLLVKRGLEVPATPGAIDKAIRRWWKEEYTGSMMPVIKAAVRDG
jgi:hypothetical protein